MTSARWSGAAFLIALSVGTAFGCGDARSDGANQDGPFKPAASARAPPDLEPYYELLRVSGYD